ncbi:hypothetical protein J4573_24680 [Actinomadura barringtoniae]|uniref:Integral membrane protein n=1 Tax=Actinomadura barringtoniae TaxID=1427535 RepID=A0A939PCY2_9ACTN|nr:hypothetical protein [Actinomadura barringtoniae]MBO2450320.1 hypothetical protein [Actinomadura barringtoniae]
MTVTVAAAVEAAQGLAAVGFGLFTAYETIAGEAVDAASAIGLTVIALLGGAGMLGCAWGLVRAESWSRAPTALTQLFSLPVAWSLWQSDQHLIGLPLGVAAVIALVAVVSPPSTAWLVADDEDDDDGDEEEVEGAGENDEVTGDAKPRSDA